MLTASLNKKNEETDIKERNGKERKRELKTIKEKTKRKGKKRKENKIFRMAIGSSRCRIEM
jgi:hypothetical protein